MGKAGVNNLLAAVHEAAWMAAMERNSDVVTMAAYAPLLQNVHDVSGGYPAVCPYVWSPILINFDASTVARSPSYWVQWLHARNRGAQNLAAAVTGHNESLAVSASTAADAPGAVVLTPSSPFSV
jgi:hypothetical protein